MAEIRKKKNLKQTKRKTARARMAGGGNRFDLSCRNNRFSDLQRSNGRKYAAEIDGQNRFDNGKRRRLSRKIFALQ